jgi:hypothetical protein
MLTITRDKVADFISDRMLELQWNSAIDGSYQTHAPQYTQLYDMVYQRLEGLKQFIELSNFSTEPETEILELTNMLNEAQQKAVQMFEAQQSDVKRTGEAPR